MSKWLEAKQIKGKFYISSADFSNVVKEYTDKIAELEEENRLLKNEIAWLKDHTRYNGITQEEYIDGTMTATEAKLILQQAEANQNYVSKLEERIRFLEQCLDNKEKVNISLREENKTLKSEIRRITYQRDNLSGIADNLVDENRYLEEENNKLKLHIEAKDKAYTALLKDYEEIKEDNKRLRAEIEEWLNTIRQKI